MVRFFSILTVMLFGLIGLRAQGFKVTVFDESQSPIPHAYIYINSQVVAATDLDGVGLLPFDKLAVNDTLNVTFLGMITQKVVLDQSIIKNQGYKFMMQEDAYDIDEVVIKGNAEKYFRKCTNLSNSIDFNCEMTAKFNAEINFSNDHTERANGTLKVRNEVSSKEFKYYRQYGWFHHPAQYTTDDDISSIKNLLNQSIYGMLNSSNLAIRGAIHKSLGNLRADYSYLGIEGNNKIFRMAYDYGGGTIWQILLYIDNKTKDLVYMDMQYFDSNSKITCFIKGSYVTYFNKKSKLITVLLPVKMALNTSFEDGKQIKLELSDTSIGR